MDKQVIEDIFKPDECDGYISRICVFGKTYKLRCEIVEVHPLICTRCGHTLELHSGRGQCPACGTNFSAVLKVVEE